MAERTALIYEKKSAVESFDSMCRILERIGIRVAYPGSECVKMLGHEGQQIEGTLGGLRRRLSTECDVSFQWWFEEAHDLYCRISWRGSVCVIEFGMEGCCDGELRILGKTLRDYFICGCETSVGFVFDSQGVAEDYDWDRFFLQGESLDWHSVGFALPTMLGFLISDMNRVRGLPESAVVVHEERVVIVDGPG
ncbi:MULTISPECIES: hypothetical protein [Sorangium]|uniref:hypothetical protein n=1 Tax=Sorangium TaxID=39643 RepID=UPI003D9C393A